MAEGLAQQRRVAAYIDAIREEGLDHLIDRPDARNRAALLHQDNLHVPAEELAAVLRAVVDWDIGSDMDRENLTVNTALRLLPGLQAETRRAAGGGAAGGGAGAAPVLRGLRVLGIQVELCPGDPSRLQFTSRPDTPADTLERAQATMQTHYQGLVALLRVEAEKEQGR